MYQIWQHPRTGECELEEVPRPQLIPRSSLIRTAASVISPGTEATMLGFGERSLVGKAIARPDMVKKIIQKGRQEGWLNAWYAARSRLDRPRPLGYSAAGVIEELAEDVETLQVGDRVAMAGAGYANHAEINVVPRNLVARVPESVTLEEAAYTTIASVALQGVRLAEPELGDRFAVVGLGLVGLLTVQVLKAHGCRVIGFDLDRERIEFGLNHGLDQGTLLMDGDPGEAADTFTRGRGVDGTIITAATESSEPVRLAGDLTRSKGRVSVVGNVGMEIPRETYYEKELSVVVSRSYGPGRYDPSYEEGGIDYPIDYVRWTEQRNMEAVLDLMAQGKLDVEALTTHRFPFERALEAYDLIRDDNGPVLHLGILLEYDLKREAPEQISVEPASLSHSVDSLGVGFVGAGNYATTHLLPHLQKHDDVRFRGLVSGGGASARASAEKFGFSYCASSVEELLADDEINALFIATRHATHAELVNRGLRAGKHVFVEKPLAVSQEQLNEIREAYQDANARRATGLMVGLNRRFAPLVSEMREHFATSPIHQMIYRINSGHISTSSWMHRPEQGGGMLVGEMCHFVDLMMFLSGDVPTHVTAYAARVDREDVSDHDNLSISVKFERGAVGILCYNTVGTKAAGKERFEVYGGGRVGWLDDFRSLQLGHDRDTKRTKKWSQDKGREQQITQTVAAFREKGRAPIPFRELDLGMRVIFAARQSLSTGSAVSVAPRS